MLRIYLRDGDVSYGGVIVSSLLVWLDGCDKLLEMEEKLFLPMESGIIDKYRNHVVQRVEIARIQSRLGS